MAKVKTVNIDGNQYTYREIAELTGDAYSGVRGAFSKGGKRLENLKDRVRRAEKYKSGNLTPNEKRKAEEQFKKDEQKRQEGRKLSKKRWKKSEVFEKPRVDVKAEIERLRIKDELEGELEREEYGYKQKDEQKDEQEKRREPEYKSLIDLIDAVRDEGTFRYNAKGEEMIANALWDDYGNFITDPDNFNDFVSNLKHNIDAYQCKYGIYATRKDEKYIKSAYANVEFKFTGKLYESKVTNSFKNNDLYKDFDDYLDDYFD